MDLKHLFAVLAVARHQSFTGAAAELFMSQPTVSRHVAAAEREIGSVLFERQAHGARLTPAGQTFLPYAESIAAMLDEGLRAAQVTAESNVAAHRSA